MPRYVDSTVPRTRESGEFADVLRTPPQLWGEFEGPCRKTGR